LKKGEVSFCAEHKMKHMLIVAIALFAAACADETTKTGGSAQNPDAAAAASAAPTLQSMPSWENARSTGVDFRAVGQEPGWMLDLYADGRANLVWDYGDKGAAFAGLAISHPQEGSTQYDASGAGHALRVVTQRFPCQDAMSGEAYPARVTVTIDGRALEGCGKSV
jgi:uncharacterized membrane protein